jgi:hypothetical protein
MLVFDQDLALALYFLYLEPGKYKPPSVEKKGKGAQKGKEVKAKKEGDKEEQKQGNAEEKEKEIEEKDTKEGKPENGEKGEKDGKEGKVEEYHKFSEWEKMPTTLEFDHQGAFQRYNGDVWMYEGGESKSSMDGSHPLLSKKLTSALSFWRCSFSTRPPL